MSKMKLDPDKIDKMSEAVKKQQKESKEKGEETIERFSNRLRLARRKLRR